MNSKIKVLMVGALPLDLQSVKGGVEAAILNLFSGFSQLDTVEVVHVSFLEEVREQIEVQYAPNVKIYFVPFKIKFRLVDYIINRATLRKIIAKEAPHIIHIQESEPHLLRFLSVDKKNIVVTQHGIMKEELKYATGVKGKLKFLFKALVERYVFPSFRNVIFISNYNKKLFTGTLQKSVNIYNAVSPIFFEHSPKTEPKQNAIIYVGVLNKRKNLRLVIEAIHELKRKGIIYQLHVVGWYKENDHEYERIILEMVKSYALADQIKFYGWLKQPEMLEVFDRVSTFVLPSLQETLPVSIAEAMALGKIVIASNVGAISEMFENQTTGYLFSKNDLNKLVSLLETLYTNQKKAADLSSAIKKMAIEKYHPKENATRTLNFYKEVLEANSAAI
jgi:glycosyltransferase involved in cell wall biosynthesis